MATNNARIIHQPRAGVDVPDVVRVGSTWTEQMREMADHVGPHATLTIVAHLGGERLYVPKDPALSPFNGFVPEAIVATLSDIYGGNYFEVPTGRAALAQAQRASVIADVRAGRLTKAGAARILHTTRSYVHQLVKRPDEGLTDGEAAPIRAPSPQLDLFR